MSFEIWITLSTSIGFALGFYAATVMVSDQQRYDMARNDAILARAIGRPA